jgi:DNA-binding MarR family transcriptional regulator
MRGWNVNDETTLARREQLISQTIEQQKLMFQAIQGVEMPEWIGSDMTMPQFKILFLLYSHGWMRMGGTEKEPGIAFFLGKNISTATGIVDRLVEQGLLRRKEDPDDRRVVVVGLTEKGVEVCDTFLQFGWKNARRMFDRLTTEELEIVAQGQLLMTRAAMQEATEQTATSTLRRTDNYNLGKRTLETNKHHNN